MNLVQSIDWLAIGAPTILAVAAVVVLLVDAFLPTRFLPATLTLMAVLAAAVPTWLLWGDPARGTFCTGDALEGPELCSFSTDAFTLVVWGIVLFGTAVVALIGTAAVVDGRTPAGEWHFLLLCSAAGAVTLAASRDLITLISADTVLSLGLAPVATIAADLVMSSAPPERAGAASGLNETSSEFGGALGIALLGSILTVLYRGGLGDSLPQGLSGEAVAMALRGIGGAHSAAESLPKGGVALLEAARVAYADAMLVTSLLGAAIVLVAAVTTIAMFRGIRPATA